MPTDETLLPHYARPPVVETILGVQFDRFPALTSGHLGAFWKSLDESEWNSVSDAPALPPQFERFTDVATWGKGLTVQFSQLPDSRLQIRNRSNDRMIQVQNGRFHFNWLGGGTYPRYPVVRDGFILHLQKFIKFAEKENSATFRPNQWEVTYINQIPQGTLWASPADWTFFTPLRPLTSIPGVVDGESFSGEWHFTIPEQRGRLHVGWQHGLMSSPNANEMIQLTFTARGPLVESEKDTITEIGIGVDIGRNVIVRAFAKLMSDRANDEWGLKHAGD